MMLKDLSTGDEFKYVTTKPAYRDGIFLVLGDDSSYLRPVAVDNCKFLFSYATKKVVRHFEEQEVIKKETNVSIKNRMGHFVDWKFGVPVKVFAKSVADQVKVSGEVRLVYENYDIFALVSQLGNGCLCSKQHFHYELIPHKYINFSPRYPVCQAPAHTAFCNSGGIMTVLDVGEGKLKPYPTATLIIDGKTIELSAETTAELKKELGV